MSEDAELRNLVPFSQMNAAPHEHDTRGHPFGHRPELRCPERLIVSVQHCADYSKL